MKKCSKCDKKRPLNEFAKKGNGHTAHCKECHREICKEHYKANKAYYRKRNKAAQAEAAAWLAKRKDSPCLDCGHKFPPECMDFDHLHSKVNEVSKLVSSGMISLLEKEIAKCELVCSNCHRIRTAKRRK
jgi:hypothetical protein